MELPQLRAPLYYQRYRKAPTLLNNYLDCKCPIYDSVEAGRTNRPRSHFWIGQSGAYVDLTDPETIASSSNQMHIRMATLWHPPGRPMRAVKAVPGAVDILFTESKYDSDNTWLTLEWKDPAALPLVQGFAEALLMECPDSEEEISDFLSELRGIRARLIKSTEKEMARYSAKYPPDPAQLRERQIEQYKWRRAQVFEQNLAYAKEKGVPTERLFTNTLYKSIRPATIDEEGGLERYRTAVRSIIDNIAQFDNTWRTIYQSKFTHYADARGVSLQQVWAHPRCPKIVALLPDGTHDWPSYEKSVYEVIDELAGIRKDVALPGQTATAMSATNGIKPTKSKGGRRKGTGQTHPALVKIHSKEQYEAVYQEFISDAAENYSTKPERKDFADFLSERQGGFSIPVSTLNKWLKDKGWTCPPS